MTPLERVSIGVSTHFVPLLNKGNETTDAEGKRCIIILFYIISLIVIAIDQLSKLWVRSSMVVGGSRPFLDPYVHFEYYQNTGAAFSSFQGYGKLFVVFAVFVTAVIIYYRTKGVLKGTWMELATGFLVGGAIGNAIDRVLFGKVTDFIVLGRMTGIMNIADIAINIGIVAIILSVIFRREPKQSYS
ncbi:MULTISPECIES: signal peptidase II [Paenibacillus]|uniref:signal peptidase II n=1 Tax=Paenibacillus TaxID=44249 RepID=UPI001F2EE04A|nr:MULTISPECIES: signal peptidase II [Paenibacillus]MEC0177263.1 signal peptidase II [Paenibacillus favisporus]